MVGDWREGYRIHAEEGYADLVAVRFFHETGVATDRSQEALGVFRLLADAGPRGGSGSLGSSSA